MLLRTYRTFQALILAGLGLFLLDKIWSGRLVLYINQRYAVLILLAGLGLLALAQGVLNARPGLPSMPPPTGAGTAVSPQTAGKAEEAPPGSRFNLLLVVIPILLGLVVPARPLGANALPARGVNVSSPLSVSGSAVASAASLAPTDRDILDWIRAFSGVSDPVALGGEEADVTGFVYHDPRLSKDEFMVGRFAITCCVADALAIGMVVAWPKAAEISDNGWVRVRGTVKVIELEGHRIPMIEAESVEDLPVPDQPYLFP